MTQDYSRMYSYKDVIKLIIVIFQAASAEYTKELCFLYFADI